MAIDISAAINNLTLLDDVCSQINTYQNKLMKHVYEVYFEGNTKDTYGEFKNKIIKRHRPLYVAEGSDNEDDYCELPPEKRCSYNIWNKGRIRRCKLVRYKDLDNCKKHFNYDNLFDADSESSESESESESISASNTDSSNYSTTESEESEASNN